MKWSVAEAREHFSDLLRKAATETQQIYDRDRLVAAVVGPDSFRQWSEAMERTSARTLRESFAELRKLMAQEGYELEVPKSHE